MQSLGCKPVANVDDFTAEKLGYADLVEEVPTGSSKIIKVRRGRAGDRVSNSQH
jgi:T-complex protein 1 subunit delta